MNPRALTSSAVACLAIVAAACGSSSSSGSSGSDAKTVAVTLSDDGCSPANATVPAGAVTFNVTNSGSAKVTELELLNEDGVIIGERENVIEGVPASFSLKLQPGNYKLSCPNGDTTPEGTLKVTGERFAAADGASAALLKQATTGYKRYVDCRDRQTTDRNRCVRGRAQGRRHPKGQGSVRQNAHPLRGDRAGGRERSATSTPKSTRASTTLPTPASGPVFTASRRCFGWETAPRAPAPTRTS